MTPGITLDNLISSERQRYSIVLTLIDCLSFPGRNIQWKSYPPLGNTDAHV